MTDRHTTPVTGYRADVRMRQLARSTSALRRIRDLEATPAQPQPDALLQVGRTGPARKTAPRRPTTRQLADDPAAPASKREAPPNGDADLDHNAGRADRAHAKDTAQPPHEDGFEAEPHHAPTQLRAPALRDAASLPPTISVVEAGAWLGIGRTTAYQLANEGIFPVRTIRVGNQRRVITVELLTLLGIPLAT